MRTLSRTWAAVGLLLAGSVVAAPGSEAATTKVVSMTSSSFSPSPVRVVKGTVVKWKNTSLTTHTSTSDTGLWNSGNVAPGGTYQRAFKRVGKFRYHCKTHPAMTSTVIVRSP